MTRDQWIALGLLAAGFLVGWLARAAASRDLEREAIRLRSLEPPPRVPELEPPPAPEPTAPVPSVADVRAALVRARTAYRAVIAIWNRDAGFPSLLGKHALDILEDELERIEPLAEGFEANVGAEDPRADALETALNELAVLERHVRRYAQGKPLTHEVRVALEPHERRLDDALAAL